MDTERRKGSDDAAGSMRTRTGRARHGRGAGTLREQGVVTVSMDARGYINARDNAGAYRSVLEDLEARELLRNELDAAEEALGRWETEHEHEYKRLFWLGEQAALNALDAEWNALSAEVEATRDALRGWSL